MATIKVLNKHTAAIDGIPPGAIGEVDPENPGIVAQGRAGLLVAVAPTEASDDEEARPPTTAEGLAMMKELHARGARLAELEAELARAKSAQSPAPAAPDEVKPAAADEPSKPSPAPPRNRREG